MATGRQAMWVMLAVVAGPGAAAAQGELAPAPVAALTVFVNGHGGVLRAGTDDPAALRSDILTVHGQDAAELPRFEGTRAEWAGMMACVRGHFAGLPVRFVDQAPTEPDHLMIMVGGRPEHTGSTDGEWGRAPMSVGEVVPRGVGFAFSAAMQFDRVHALCHTVAHEVGHMLGLDHSSQCGDLMHGGGCSADQVGFTPAARRQMAAALAAPGGGGARVAGGVEAPEPPAPDDDADEAAAQADAGAPVDPYDAWPGGDDVSAPDPGRSAGDDGEWGSPFEVVGAETDLGQVEPLDDVAADQPAGEDDVASPEPRRCGQGHASAQVRRHHREGPRAERRARRGHAGANPGRWRARWRVRVTTGDVGW